MLSSKKLSIMHVVHNSLCALLKSKYVAAYLLHAESTCEVNMSSIVNEKIIDKETDTMEYESVEGIRTHSIHKKCLTFVLEGEESRTRYYDILPARD